MQNNPSPLNNFFSYIYKTSISLFSKLLTPFQGHMWPSLSWQLRVPGRCPPWTGHPSTTGPLTHTHARVHKLRLRQLRHASSPDMLIFGMQEETRLWRKPTQTCGEHANYRQPPWPGLFSPSSTLQWNIIRGHAIYIKNQWRYLYVLEKSSDEFWYSGGPTQSWESLNKECSKSFWELLLLFSIILHLFATQAVEYWLIGWNSGHLGLNCVLFGSNCQRYIAGT